MRNKQLNKKQKNRGVIRIMRLKKGKRDYKLPEEFCSFYRVGVRAGAVWYHITLITPIECAHYDTSEGGIPKYICKLGDYFRVLPTPDKNYYLEIEYLEFKKI